MLTLSLTPHSIPNSEMHPLWVWSLTWNGPRIRQTGVGSADVVCRDGGSDRDPDDSPHPLTKLDPAGIIFNTSNNSPGVFSCIRAGANTGATCIRTGIEFPTRI